MIIGTAYLPKPGPHHEFVPRATSWLSARAQALAHHQEASPHGWTCWAVYDAIKGLTGIGRILLAAHAAGHHAEANDGLRAALTTLTRMILTSQGNRPGWWLPAHAHPPTVRVPTSGAATTGLAHGIAGPLALLAIAQRAGHTVSGQREAIRAAAHWLLTWADPGSSWPPYISGAELDTGPGPGTSDVRGRKTAWCYGIAGTATALTHASRALNDSDLWDTARTALAHIAPYPGQWDTEGTAICHGSAGILLASSRCTPHLADTVANASLTMTSATPGFLNGNGGSALALADYAGLLAHPQSAAWDAILLLS
ncbi:lanthionine synthetase LanC family protein [Streptomyces sp. TRM 70351]|uniref:lanthionine synthetase LanC family protein n=1 Tax=Streptomyces sp. TRM 70351 TaxID=3116552 RepID=UPI002E7B20C1|nr:lanthionine synthetase LanC family protein [Streptomyces sp. TRM 70351]MEE1927389.1 lanthionine synthetase LanC family protein [Streptomyces sp. TRM 70351]